MPSIIAAPSNKALLLTPMRVDKIVAILKVGLYSIVFPIYRCGAAER
jgi:hypothetical protein